MRIGLFGLCLAAMALVPAATQGATLRLDFSLTGAEGYCGPGCSETPDARIDGFLTFSDRDGDGDVYRQDISAGHAAVSGMPFGPGNQGFSTVIAGADHTETVSEAPVLSLGYLGSLGNGKQAVEISGAGVFVSTLFKGPYGTMTALDTYLGMSLDTRRGAPLAALYRSPNRYTYSFGSISSLALTSDDYVLAPRSVQLRAANAAPVPLPATLSALLIALAALPALRRRRRH
ncbi:hypothetical protein CLV78_10135 [Aliiruegeria haliotis]|uniref:Secreted protein n=1 Tax=Aliiruegeria haliotis TaxID=1280846 RepID=A0A2T0RXN0_9RHOB|nr:hypothetical protein [Aliiruegeria haliotis]PRY25944.1 hypothetical protein CLV78_10135 [Aliiruegeria haliotis]